MNNGRRGPYGKRKLELFYDSVTDVDLSEDHCNDVESDAESAGHNFSSEPRMDFNVFDAKEQCEIDIQDHFCMCGHDLDEDRSSKVSTCIMQYIWMQSLHSSLSKKCHKNGENEKKNGGDTPT